MKNPNSLEVNFSGINNFPDLVHDLIKNPHNYKKANTQLIDDIRNKKFDYNESVDLPSEKNAGKGWTLLHHLAASNELLKNIVKNAEAEKIDFKNVIEFLIEAFPGIDLNPAASDETGAGVRPIHIASFNNNLEFVKAVIEVETKRNPAFKASEFTNSTDSLGNMPLHYAAVSEEAEDGMVEFLLDNGADKEAKNKDDKTPLELAVIADKERNNELQNEKITSQNKERDQLSQEEWEKSLSPAESDYYFQAARTLEEKFADNQLRNNNKLKLLGAAVGAVSSVAPFGNFLSAGAKVATTAVELYQKNKDGKKLEELSDKRYYRDLAEKIAREMTEENREEIVEIAKKEQNERNDILPQISNGVEKFFRGIVKSASEKLAMDDCDRVTKVIVDQKEEVKNVLNQNYETLEERNLEIAKCLGKESKKEEKLLNSITKAVATGLKPLTNLLNQR